MQALERLRELPSLVDVAVPDDEHITVCGDVHGQYYDLLNIFKMNGLPSPQNPYLFNGALPSPALLGIPLIPEGETRACIRGVQRKGRDVMNT